MFNHFYMLLKCGIMIRSLLPAYFMTLEKYFKINNISDENMRFVCLSNIMSPSQAEAHRLALSRASGNIEPYTALKNLILSCFVRM